MRFWRVRVGAYCIRPEMSCADGLGLKSDGFWVYSYWGNMKPDKFCTYPCRGAKAYTPECPATAVFGYKTGRVLGVSLLGKVKSGAFLAYPYAEI